MNNTTVSAERIHIGFFGRQNAGKSSLVNCFVGQNLSLVSDYAGTTSDPIKKSMELLPLGPVVIIDTAGIDDVGEIGEMRVQKALQVIEQVDIAILVADVTKGLTEYDLMLISKFKEKKLKYIIVYNKCDLLPVVPEKSQILNDDGVNEIYVSAIDNINIHELKEATAHILDNDRKEKYIVADLINKGDIVVLVVPIDESAPKGRLILPQQQTLREILDAGAIAMVTKDTELSLTLESLGRKPALVITDSQVFGYVSSIVPGDIPLTSFSILMMRYKGNLETAINGAEKLDHLSDGDKILIVEGCTHHRQCNDIGTVKFPKWLSDYTGKDLKYDFSSGHYFPENLSEYSLIIHCGGCMLTDREVMNRMQNAANHNVAITNYGVAIAKMNGILERSVEIQNEFKKTYHNDCGNFNNLC